MNVLFYTSFEVSPQKGGTERITASIATSLKRYYGVKCYSVYGTAIDSTFVRTPFVKSMHISHINRNKSALYDFIEENEIDIIVNQGSLGNTKAIREVLNSFSGKRLIFVHHFNPGAEKNFMQIKTLLHDIEMEGVTFKRMTKLLVYPLRKWMLNHKLPQLYRETYFNSDKVVLLSHNFKEDFLSYAHISECQDKIIAIHNALSFDTFFDMASYDNKKKEVLIVSRLEERQKRISTALRIWMTIEQDKDLNDWILRIVGHGEDEQKYRKFVRRNNLRRVSFEGIQQPEKYYKDASLFMLTSSYEGWGLTLTEAQQFGCVPLAFNSYASLTDIISNGENGFIIQDNDINGYAEQLISIMKDNRQRKAMAHHAIESCKKFKSEKICQEWMDVFRNIADLY